MSYRAYRMKQSEQYLQALALAFDKELKKSSALKPQQQESTEEKKDMSVSAIA